MVFTDRPKPRPPGADPAVEEWDTSEEKKTFLYISLALPPAPLFKDSMDRNMIPQVCALVFPKHPGKAIRIEFRFLGPSVRFAEQI